MLRFPAGKLLSEAAMKETTVQVFFDTGSAAATPYRKVLEGIRAAAARSGVRVLTTSEKELAGDAPADAARAAIVASDSLPVVRSVIQLLRKSGRPCVLAGLDAEPFGPDVSCAAPSRQVETSQMIQYLCAIGCARIALVGFGLRSINDNYRLRAAVSAAASLEIPLDSADILTWESDPLSAVDRFLERSGQYQAAVCPNDNMAIQLIRRCGKKGVRVPESLKVCSFGDKIIGRYCFPSLTTVSMDTAAVGEYSFYAWQLLSRQPKEKACALRLTVPSRLLIRESTACLQPAKKPELPLPALETDPFYSEPAVQPLARLENCLSACDDLDLRILALLMENRSYEAIVETLFISESALKYRLNKIYTALAVSGKADCIRFIREQLAGDNPFRSHLPG